MDESDYRPAVGDSAGRRRPFFWAISFSACSRKTGRPRSSTNGSRTVRTTRPAMGAADSGPAIRMFRTASRADCDHRSTGERPGWSAVSGKTEPSAARVISSAAAPRPSPTRPASVASRAKKRISAAPSTTAASGPPAPSVTRTDHRARNSAMNWRTTWSWPSRRHWSSTADAALIATGAVTSGSDAAIITRLRASALNRVVSHAKTLVPKMPLIIGSSLRAGEGDSLDERALSEEEQDDDRGGRRGGAGHDPGPVRRVVPEARRQAQRQRVAVLVADVDQRAQVVVPAVHELEQDDGRHGRLGQRQDDPAVDVELVRPVDARGLRVRLRDRHEELPQQERAEDRAAEERGHLQRQVRADPSEPLVHDEKRDQRADVRQGHRVYMC